VSARPTTVTVIALARACLRHRVPIVSMPRRYKTDPGYAVAHASQCWSVVLSCGKRTRLLVDDGDVVDVETEVDMSRL
jgi:hypothetical protein